MFFVVFVMDGYVICYEDLSGFLFLLKVIGEVLVGYGYGGLVGMGEVVWIFIGVLVLDGVDIILI